MITNPVTTNAPGWITLMATNDVGLYTNAIVRIQVASLLPVTGEWFGNTNLAWTSGGDASWFAQGITTYDAYPAAQTGAVGNNQVSWLQTTMPRGWPRRRMPD